MGVELAVEGDSYQFYLSTETYSISDATCDPFRLRISSVYC